MNKDNWGSNLVCFLLGAATGAAIALLYAPQEGEATRRFLGEKASEVKDKAAEMTSNVAQTAKDTWGTVSDKAQNMMNRGRQAAQDGMDKVSEKTRTAVDSIS